MIPRSITTFDGGYGLLSPPPSEPRTSPYEERDLSSNFAQPRLVTELPDKLLRIILSNVLITPDVATNCVRPWYKHGMLGGYIRTGNDPQTNTIQEVTQNNIDISQTLLVCKKFAELGQELFYGEAWFQFHDADAFKWWYKQIGPKNVARLQKLAVQVRPGFKADALERCSLDVSSEERWLQCFRELRSRHRLVSLEITVTKKVHYINQDGLDEIRKYRRLLLDELLRYRNLKDALLVDYTGVWGDRRECREYEDVMTRREGVKKTRMHVPMKRPTLDQLRYEIRLNHLEQEIMARQKRDRQKRARNLQDSRYAVNDFGFDPTPSRSYYGNEFNPVSSRPASRQTFIGDYSTTLMSTESQGLGTRTNTGTRYSQTPRSHESDFYDELQAAQSFAFDPLAHETSYQLESQQTFDPLVNDPAYHLEARGTIDNDFPAPEKTSRLQRKKTYSRKNKRQENHLIFPFDP